MKVVLIGAGVSGFSILKNLQDSKDFRIFLIEKQESPFRKHLLIDWLIGKVSDSDFFFPLESLKDKTPSLEVVKDRALKVNFEKKKIFLKESESLDFDKIILCCGVRAKRMLFPGVYKEGVYYLGEEPSKLKQDLIIYEHIIIYSQTSLGIKLAKSLSSLGKDIKIVIGDSPLFSQEFIRKIQIFLGEKIPLYLNSQIEEALGEGRVRAIKLSIGKFLACDILIMDSGYLPNLSLLKDYPTMVEESVLRVDEYLRAGFPDCLACGDIVNSKLLSQLFKDNKSLAEEEARIVANNILELKDKFIFPNSEQDPIESILEF